MQRLLSVPILLLALFCTAPACYAQSAIFYSELHTFNFGGPLPLHQLINNLEGDVFPGTEKNALSHFDWELGMKISSGWKIGAFVRHDYYTRFTPDTIRLIHQDKNDLPVDTNQHYDIWLKIHHLRADGIRLHLPEFAYQSLQVGLSISLFHARGLMDGEILGQIDTTNNSFAGLLNLDYSYDRDRLLNRSVNSPTGWGLGLDLKIHWDISPNIDVDFQLKDIAARVRWQKAPYTTAQLTSSTVNFDANGFIETTPALSGFEGYRSYTQKLPLQSKLQLLYRLSKQYGVLVIDELYATEHFPSFGFKRWNGDSTHSLAWQPRTQTLQFGWENETYRLKLSADHINPKQIKTFGLEFSVLFGA